MSLRKDDSGTPRELPRWAWLWFPPVLAVVELGWRLADEPSYRRLWDSEHGPVENATVLILVPGIVAGILLLLRYRDGLPARSKSADGL